VVCGPAQIPQIPELLTRALQEKNVGCAPHTKEWWAKPTLQTDRLVVSFLRKQESINV
jgi:hypothetical protein